MSWRRYRAQTADDIGVTRGAAAITQWKAFNDANIDPADHMEYENFGIAKEYMRQRLDRMFRAMLTVWPHIAARIENEGFSLRGIASDFIINYFMITHNRVWKLINDSRGLTQMRMRFDEWWELQHMFPAED